MGGNKELLCIDEAIHEIKPVCLVVVSSKSIEMIEQKRKRCDEDWVRTSKYTSYARVYIIGTNCCCAVKMSPQDANEHGSINRL